MQSEMTFYVVWCPSHGQPMVRHATHEIALAEAKRLASINAGCDFYVLAASKLVKRAEPVIVIDLDDLPF